MVAARKDLARENPMGENHVEIDRCSNLLSLIYFTSVLSVQNAILPQDRPMSMLSLE